MPESDSIDDETRVIARLEDRVSALEADLRQKKEIILAQHTKLEAFFDTSIDAVVQMDFDGYITGWNQRAEEMFGWQASEILEQPIADTIIPERYRDAHREGLKRYLETGESMLMNSLTEMHALHRDGHEFPIELSLAVVNSPDLQEFSAHIRDISERKRAESIIWKQANFDSLTGLPNRDLFLERLEHEARSCDRTELSLALMYIDLDRFKDVNDSMGHDIGDLLLVQIAERLKHTVREIDTVSRLSGDEFTIILGQIDDQIAVQRVCQELLENLARPFELAKEQVHMTASIGVSFYPSDASDLGDLQRYADQAMYAAKRRGRNRYRFFTPELQERAQRKRKMIDELRDAVQQSEFEVFYQPIINLRDESMNWTEALLRWHHPESHMVSPAVFIPLAEETGLITSIGNWVFYQACQQIQSWRETFRDDFRVSINTSPLQWVDEAVSMNRWFSHLQSQDLAGTAITVEINESLLADAGDHITNRLLDFRDADIQIAIDDFGTGHSSLADIHQYGIGYLKIDQSFIRNLDTDEDDRNLCQAIVAMAHTMGIQVIAEGVETAEQDRLLRDFGCDYAQGYLYSRPLSAVDFTALLASKT